VSAVTSPSKSCFRLDWELRSLLILQVKQKTRIFARVRTARRRPGTSKGTDGNDGKEPAAKGGVIGRYGLRSHDFLAAIAHRSRSVTRIHHE
jgi:hypothetical protein